MRVPALSLIRTLGFAFDAFGDLLPGAYAQARTLTASLGGGGYVTRTCGDRARCAGSLSCGFGSPLLDWSPTVVASRISSYLATTAAGIALPKLGSSQAWPISISVVIGMTPCSPAPQALKTDE